MTRGLLLALLLTTPAVAQGMEAREASARYEGWSWAASSAPPALADTTRRAPPADPWLGRDKALHAGGSFLLTLSGQYVLVAKLDRRERHAWPIAAGATLALGLAKEVADGQRARNPLFSWRDLAADALGVGLAVALIQL